MGDKGAGLNPELDLEAVRVLQFFKKFENLKLL